MHPKTERAKESVQGEKIGWFHVSQGGKDKGGAEISKMPL
jgi:hypothetical protein